MSFKTERKDRLKKQIEKTAQKSEVVMTSSSTIKAFIGPGKQVEIKIYPTDILSYVATSPYEEWFLFGRNPLESIGGFWKVKPESMVNYNLVMKYYEEMNKK